MAGTLHLRKEDRTGHIKALKDTTAGGSQGGAREIAHLPGMQDPERGEHVPRFVLPMTSANMERHNVISLSEFLLVFIERAHTNGFRDPCALVASRSQCIKTSQRNMVHRQRSGSSDQELLSETL